MMVSVQGLPVAVEQLKKKIGKPSNEVLAQKSGVTTSTMRRYATAGRTDAVRTHKEFVEAFSRYYKSVMRKEPALRITA